MENSNVFANENLTRQLDIVPMGILGEPITVIGAGAIGGWTTLALAKMGFGNITVIDFDNVDTVNLNSQFFRFSDVGKSKVEALKDLVRDFTKVEITARHERYERGIFPGIVIAAVDSMEVRSNIWKNHAKRSPFTRAIVDPRMGGQAANLYVVDPMDRTDLETYPASLHGDNEALQERCTNKAVIFTAHLLSGLVCKAVADRLTRPDYLRSAQWDIRENDFIAFKKVSPT